MIGNDQYGTKLGRLTYRTAEEARAVADELGLSSVHSHKVDGMRVFQPGSSHDALNKALKRRNLRPMKKPGKRNDMGMGGGGLFDLGGGDDGFY